MTENISKKRVKARTIITRFRKDESIILEELSSEYGLDVEKFFDILKYQLGDREYGKWLKVNETRKRRQKDNKTSSKGEENMKARPVRMIESDSSKNNSSELMPACNVMANPTLEINKKIIKSELEKRAIKSPKKKEEGKITVTEKVAEDNTEMKTLKEENTMKATVENATLQELEERKEIITVQISGEEQSVESNILLLEMAKEEQTALKEKVQDLKEQLNTAEEELLNKECEIEKIESNIKASEARVNRYKQEIVAVEEQIAKASVVYLVSPSYRGHPKMDGFRYVAASSSSVREGVEVDSYGEDLLDEMTRKQIKALAAENDYNDIEKFAQDYAFALLVKKYHEDGVNYCIKTRVGAPVNALLDKFIGKDMWNHD